MRFSKYHALGNDYLVIEAADANGALTPEAVRRICDRHRGIGSDGILLRERPDAQHGFRLRILNPDGSEAEKSGNGLRIFARYLFDRAEVGTEPFSVWTKGGVVICRVVAPGNTVVVDMGRASFASRDIPVAGPPREVIAESMEIDGTPLSFTAVTVGNPHCVILREKVTAEEAIRLGPQVEMDARFPHRTNVQFMLVLDRTRLRIEIWERGAGYTLASGSSSCAAAAAAHRLGLCDASVTVLMPGGSLAIEIGPDYAIRMTGPVVRVASGELFVEALGDLSAPTNSI